MAWTTTAVLAFTALLFPPLAVWLASHSLSAVLLNILLFLLTLGIGLILHGLFVVFYKASHGYRKSTYLAVKDHSKVLNRSEDGKITYYQDPQTGNVYCKEQRLVHRVNLSHAFVDNKGSLVVPEYRSRKTQQGSIVYSAAQGTAQSTAASSHQVQIRAPSGSKVIVPSSANGTSTVTNGTSTVTYGKGVAAPPSSPAFQASYRGATVTVTDPLKTSSTRATDISNSQDAKTETVVTTVPA